MRVRGLSNAVTGAGTKEYAIIEIAATNLRGNTRRGSLIKRAISDDKHTVPNIVLVE